MATHKESIYHFLATLGITLPGLSNTTGIRPVRLITIYQTKSATGPELVVLQQTIGPDLAARFMRPAFEY